MRFKFLLVLILVLPFMVKAQEPYKNLIISEARVDDAHWTYLEICNMGDETINLGEFKIGIVEPWQDPWGEGGVWESPEAYGAAARFPEAELAPGETFVVANVEEWGVEQEAIDPEFGARYTKAEIWGLADLYIHVGVGNGDPTDSISPAPWPSILGSWQGRACIYIEHVYSEIDSVVIDQVNGRFDGDDGRRSDQGPDDVAGVPDATANSILVRKYNVKAGNLNWDAGKGVDISDSEWIPIRTKNSLEGYNAECNGKEYWTLGNHANTVLNESTLKSETVEIDWDAMEMKVDWGARGGDSIINEFEFLEGVAWQYHYSADAADSAFMSVRTGDSLTLYGCGETLDVKKFGLTLVPPTDSEARVIPKNRQGADGGWTTVFEVTDGKEGMDVISEVGYATRIDTLYKYLEKADGATWEIVFVDEVERPDLKDGDILKVTAKDGSTTKEYLIDETVYIPSHNANLSAITWPDIPAYYKGIFGWTGDTIPGFSPSNYSYTVQVPLDVDAIPALVASTQNSDTKVNVKRASSLKGSLANKTVVFNTTAEDDSVKLEYRVILEKEKDLDNVQPYEPEPFFSQYAVKMEWAHDFLEICNPGNQPLDMNKYLIVSSGDRDPYSAFNTATGVDAWASRNNRYVPGYTWVDEASWQVEPGLMEKDLAVSTIVDPGDVFVIAHCGGGATLPSTGNVYPEFDQIDVNFHPDHNPWGADVGKPFTGWTTDSKYLYKITNDSVLNGLKPLTDVNDVVVIDVIDGSGPVDGVNFGGANANFGMWRKPNIYKGNTTPLDSYGDGTLGSGEWTATDEPRNQAEGRDAAFWSWKWYWSSNGLGIHPLDPITEYISTVSSSTYTVSPGFGSEETIGNGIKEGISQDDFESYLSTYEGQTLVYKRGGDVLGADDGLKNGDILEVTSANGDNVTIYTIETNETGISSDAVLTSDVYTITVDGATATITGFDLGTTLRDVYENVTAPALVQLFEAYYEDGSYASLNQLRLDSTYNDVLANDEVYFKVVAQDGVTVIDYQLVPNGTDAEAYVLSNVFDVKEVSKLISLVTEGINVDAFLANLIAAPGATMKVVNKMGQDRTFGSIYADDILVVTAKDGVTTAEYALSMWNDFVIGFDAILSSEVWDVTQSTLKVTGPIGPTTVEQFIEGLTVSIGASFVVLNSDDEKITTGRIPDDCTVVVTSGNGQTTNIYRVVVDRTAVVEFDNSAIKVYPNPTNGMLNFEGVTSGQVIEVYNTIGRKVLKVEAAGGMVNASISEQPNGLYMVVVTENTNRVAQFKLVKQ